MGKRGVRIGLISFIFVFVTLIILISPPAYAQSDRLTIKFHSTGESRNVTIDLTKYLPFAQEYVHSPVQNVTVIITGHFATIISNPGWAGNEIITFSANRTLIEEISEGVIGEEELTNLEPIIEMSFPQPKEFVISPGQIEFTVVAYDPDNDMLTVDWLINGVPAKKETGKGGLISHFSFNKTATEAIGSLLRGSMFDERLNYYVINSVVNDSKNQKILEWRFNVVNQSCTDMWSCTEWSECSGGKRYRQCEKVNEECLLSGNKPATEWIDPTCIHPIPGCEPNWKCDKWSGCKIDYDFGLVSKGLVSAGIKTKQERLCYDSSFCTGTTGLETRECGKSVPIMTREVFWCGQNYIEIFNSDTGRFLSRIKKYKIGETSGLDIDLSLKELKVEDYCWYCYNSIKDYDEENVDCGGSCPECIEISLMPDPEDILKFSLFLLADLALVIYIIIWLRRGSG